MGARIDRLRVEDGRTGARIAECSVEDWIAENQSAIDAGILDRRIGSTLRRMRLGSSLYVGGGAGPLVRLVAVGARIGAAVIAAAVALAMGACGAATADGLTDDTIRPAMAQRAVVEAAIGEAGE